MKIDFYVKEVKQALTGGVLDLEITDKQLANIVESALYELQGYIDETKFITVPYAHCIDLDDSEVDRVASVYRTVGNGTASDSGAYDDPMYAQRWAFYSGGSSMYNLRDYVLNYSSYITLQQISNTTSTDLAFKQDLQNNKLYINVTDVPSSITIEYIPKLQSVEDVKSSWWQQKLKELSIAMTKTILGRIRSKYKQTNALWEMDGDTLLTEGNTELTNIRETLRVNSSMIYPID